MDCVLIQHGKAHEIWRDTRKADLQTRYAPSILAAMVEVAAGTVQPGDLWDGIAFSSPPVPAPDPRRYVDTRVIIERMTDDEHFKVMKIALVDPTAAKLVNIFLSRPGRVDVNDPISKLGWDYVKLKGLTPPAEAQITPIWPGGATADARIAELLA